MEYNKSVYLHAEFWNTPTSSSTTKGAISYHSYLSHEFIFTFFNLHRYGVKLLLHSGTFLSSIVVVCHIYLEYTTEFINRYLLLANLTLSQGCRAWGDEGGEACSIVRYVV